MPNCQLQQTTPVAATVHPLIWPQVQWYRLHIDYCGLFLGHMWLVVVDATIKMGGNYSGKRSQLSADYTGSEYHFCEVWLLLLRSSVGSVSQKVFIRSFQHRSIPDQTVRRKRMVRTFKSMLKKVNPAKSEVMSAVSDMLLTYRTTPHATTGVCPYEMLF